MGFRVQGQPLDICIKVYTYNMQVYHLIHTHTRTLTHMNSTSECRRYHTMCKSTYVYTVYLTIYKQHTICKHHTICKQTYTYTTYHTICKQTYTYTTQHIHTRCSKHTLCSSKQIHTICKETDMTNASLRSISNTLATH